MSANLQTRDPYFDNLKGILIYLVFAGHCLSLYKGENFWCNLLFQVIYTFHMPLFLYISGYFSKNLEKSASKAYEALILPAIPFELLYFLLHWVTKADNFEPFLTPIFAYWYLFVLFGYRVLMPYMARLRFLLPLSAALALGVGFNAQIGEYMTLSRFFCLLPFFLLGYYTTPNQMESLRKTNLPACFVLGVGGLNGVWLLMRSGIDFDFTLATAYADPTGIVGRAVQFVLAVALSLTLMRFVPRKESFLTRIGQRTLQIYLLNFYGMTAVQILNPFVSHPALNAVMMLLLPAVMTVLLATPVVDIPYQWGMGLVKKVLMKEETT